MPALRESCCASINKFIYGCKVQPGMERVQTCTGYSLTYFAFAAMLSCAPIVNTHGAMLS